LLSGFQGRINRAKYWIAVMAYGSVMIVIFGLGFYLNFSVPFFVVAFILILAMSISGVAVGFYVLPPMFDGVGRALGSPVFFELASSAVTIWLIVELGILRGTSGPNQYGPDPLAGQ
jgi:uncharacterized membrane protein YhaH (DUF805 family)